MNFFIPKKIIVTVNVAFVSLIAFKMGSYTKEQVQNQNTNNQSAFVSSGDSKVLIEQDASKPINAVENLVKVTRVIDGDTIEIEGG